VYRLHQYQGGLYEYLGFTTLGDPELSIWTATPYPIVVEHPDFAAYEYDDITVTVTDTSGNFPKPNCVVCLSGFADSTVYAVDTTDINGTAVMSIAPQIIDDTIFVTVTGRNMYPYEGFMTVKLMSYCYMRYLDSYIDDSLGGNNDGFMNPTEAITMPMWIENIGESTGVNIAGTLRSTDPYITITDSIKMFGDVPGQDSAYTGPDGFDFSIVHSCPDEHTIEFELFLTDINDSIWNSMFTHQVHGPRFRFDGATTQGGNNNNIIEPGETLDVFITIMNPGSAAADSVASCLSTANQSIVILDSTASFGHIGVDSTVVNTTDPFTIVVDTAAQMGTVIDFSLLVTSNYLDDTLTFMMVIGEKSYYLWNPDPTPQSGENIHQILTSLGYEGDYGTVLSEHMSLYRSLFICLGVYSNRYLIETNTSEAIEITDYMNNGGRVYLEGSSAWFVDPEYFNGHDFGPLFGIQSNDWSFGTLGPITGQSNTFTNGMYFTYGGENAYMDHLTPVDSGVIIFRDVNNYYNCAIAQATTAHRTVGTDFELGLLNDGSPPSTRAALLDSIMKFLGVMNPGVKENTEYRAEWSPHFTVLPNPCKNRCMIKFNGIQGEQPIEIAIYDIAGRSVFHATTVIAQEAASYIWTGRDNLNRHLGRGVYFIHCRINGNTQTQKIILLE
jgi:hypothetical protein